MTARTPTAMRLSRTLRIIATFTCHLDSFGSDCTWRCMSRGKHFRWPSISGNLKGTRVPVANEFSRTERLFGRTTRVAQRDLEN